MTVRLARPSSGDDAGTREARRARLTCAFVNNMPDGAFDATERQFLGLLEEGSGSTVIDVRRYTVAGVPRGEPRRRGSPRSISLCSTSTSTRPTF